MVNSTRLFCVLLLVGAMIPAADVLLAQELKQPAIQQVSGSSDDVSGRFRELASRYKVDSEKFWAESSAATDEDGENRFVVHHPMNSMVAEFLELEADSRGTKIGFSCLYHLVLAAVSVGSNDLPVTRGKQAALRVLGEHYCNYPDVDTVFRYLFSGARVAESMAFVRTLSEISTLDYVRANATLELANCLASEANLPAMIKSNLSITDSANPEQARQREYLELLSSQLGSVNVDANRRESRALLDRVTRDFEDLLVPPRADTRTPVVVEVKRSEKDEILNAMRQRLGDKTPAVDFELQHGVGQEAPDIDQHDAFGQPMKLSGYRGQVVALMFSFKGCGPCEAMYPGNRKLIEELRDQPFAFLGVMNDESLQTVVESVENKTITWRVWWDGVDKSLATEWNIQGWPETYVIDKAGIIRFRGLRGESLGNAVRSLLR